MARISYSKSKYSTIYYVIEDYKKNGKRTTRKLEKVGNHKFVSEQADKEGIPVKAWLKNYLNEYLLNNIPAEPDEVIIKKYSNKIIPKNTTNKFNVGYLFLKDIYYSLKLDKIVKEISKK